MSCINVPNRIRLLWQRSRYMNPAKNYSRNPRTG